MQVRAMVRWGHEDDEDGEAPDDDRRYWARQLGGLEGLGEIPPGFPLRDEEGRTSDDAHRRWLVGHRIAARLCSGEFMGVDFLEHALAWVSSLRHALEGQTHEWWAGQIADPHAWHLARNSAANLERVSEVEVAVRRLLAVASQPLADADAVLGLIRIHALASAPAGHGLVAESRLAEIAAIAARLVAAPVP